MRVDGRTDMNKLGAIMCFSFSPLQMCKKLIINNAIKSSAELFIRGFASMLERIEIGIIRVFFDLRCMQYRTIALLQRFFVYRLSLLLRRWRLYMRDGESGQRLKQVV